VLDLINSNERNWKKYWCNNINVVTEKGDTTPDLRGRSCCISQTTKRPKPKSSWCNSLNVAIEKEKPIDIPPLSCVDCSDTSYRHREEKIGRELEY
jgi:hypothetical protein